MIQFKTLLLSHTTNFHDVQPEVTFNFDQKSEVSTEAALGLRLTLGGGSGAGRGGRERGCFSPRSLEAVMLLG